MSENKTIIVNDVELRFRELKGAEVMSFLTVYSQGIKNNDDIAIERGYEKMLSWLEAKVGNGWLKVYDPLARESIIPQLKTEIAKPSFMQKLLALLEPFL